MSGVGIVVPSVGELVDVVILRTQCTDPLLSHFVRYKVRWLSRLHARVDHVKGNLVACASID